jgi:hypothetical protein
MSSFVSFLFHVQFETVFFPVVISESYLEVPKICNSEIL